MPYNCSLYPPEWEQISREIRTMRSGGRPDTLIGVLE